MLSPKPANQTHFSLPFFTSLGILTFSVSALAMTGAPVQAQDVTVLPEIVVTQSRFGISSDKIGSAHTVVTREQIEKSGAVYVSDILRQVPGIAISRSGSFGGLTQLRMRGSEGNHVLVLIDGIEVANPVQGEYDFASLLSDNIERIEVLRGPQSALWGSNALAGVINIITRKGKKGVQATLKAEIGSFATSAVSAGMSSGTDWARASLNFSRLSTNGINISDFGNEKDGDLNQTFSFKGDIDVFSNLNFAAVLRYTDRTVDTDPQDFAFPATPTQGLIIDGNRVGEFNELFGKGEATLTLFQGHWVQRAFFKTTDVDNDNLADNAKTSGTDATRRSFGYQSTLQFDTSFLANAHHTVIGLFEQEKETFKSTSPTATAAQRATKERTLKGYVGEYRIDLWDQLFLSAAVRFDRNDAFDDASTYRLTGAYKVPQTGSRLHASYGTAVTNPTFFEQFGFLPGSFDGNPNLKPEQSRGWDIGIEQVLFQGMLTADVTYFRADLTNEINGTFDFVTFRSGVTNLDGTSKRQGVEVALTLRPTDAIELSGTYTYTSSKDANGVIEVRRPRHAGSVNATYRFMQDKARFNLGLVYNGEMKDLEFISSTPQTRVTLDDYWLINASATYEISEQVQLFGRAENLFDEHYEDIFGLNTPGQAFYMGVKVRLGG